MPLFGAESDELSVHVRHKAVEMLGGKKSKLTEIAKYIKSVQRHLQSVKT